MGQIKMRHYGTSANNKGSDGGDRNFIKSSLKVFYRLGARSVFTLFSLIFDFSILLLTISGLFLFQLSHKPMKLDFLTSAIETRLNIALGDNLRAEFKGVSLRFGEGVNGGRLNLLLRGVSLFDSSNTNIASAPIAEISVKAKYKDGKLLVERITDDGHRVIDRRIVRDNIEDIRRITTDWVNNKAIDAIITTGGTGLTGFDVTPQALEPLFDKRIDGFSVIFHNISFATIGTSTIQSRATAGVIATKFVFVLPGSPGACRDGWDKILHHQFDHNYKPCNFIEIMPRLGEHL